MNNSIALMVMHMPEISSSLSHGCVWTASQVWIAVAKACIIFLCCIGVFLVVIFKASVIGLRHLSGISLPAVCDLLLC